MAANLPSSASTASTWDALIHPAYAKLKRNLEQLLSLLMTNPWFGPFRNKVTYMYDFLARTRSFLLKVNPTLPPESKEHWTDCVQRAIFANVLINDRHGKLDALCQDGPLIGAEVAGYDRYKKFHAPSYAAWRDSLGLSAFRESDRREPDRLPEQPAKVVFGEQIKRAASKVVTKEILEAL